MQSTRVAWVVICRERSATGEWGYSWIDNVFTDSQLASERQSALATRNCAPGYAKLCLDIPLTPMTMRVVRDLDGSSLDIMIEQHPLMDWDDPENHSRHSFGEPHKEGEETC